MYLKKAPTSELPDKGPYTYHKIISHDNIKRNWNQGFYRIISIDPGEKNLAIRIERRSPDAKNIITEFFDKYDLSTHSTISKNYDSRKESSISEVYDITINILDKYKQYFLESHMILIERQMTINYRMVRLSQCIITYFLITLKNAIYCPMIYEISNKLKSDMLNAPKGLNPKEMKQWAIQLAILILEQRGDHESKKIIETAPKRKQDDLSDVVIQIEAFLYYHGYKTTYEIMDIVSEKTKFSISAKIPSNDNKQITPITNNVMNYNEVSNTNISKSINIPNLMKSFPSLNSP